MNKKNIKEFLKKRWYYIATSMLLLVVVLINIVPNSFAQKYAIRSINITSESLNYEQKEGGSFHIDKSAEWTGKNKARLTFDLDTIGLFKENYQDIIFVLDVSGSMSGNKLERVKSDASELIETLLSNSNNRAALITFETISSIQVKDLTNDKSRLLNAINGLNAFGSTNYYDALKNVEDVLEGYQKESNRELTLLFLTDGYPNENTPNEIGEYEYLKSEYPYMTINGIQYEMGSEIQDPIKKISDNQFKADMVTLNNVLFVASQITENYDEFTIIDYINDEYFDIESVNSINVSTGNVQLAGNKITWNLAPFRSGGNATMTIDLIFKGENIESGGYYPTNKGEEVKTKIDDNEEDIDTPKTPVLKGNYNVIYEGNNPSCSNITVPSTKSYLMYSAVEISEEIPVCEGYQFKGWEIANKNVAKINNDYFQMPEEDVTIRAIWSKLSLSKSMDGEVYEAKRGIIKNVTSKTTTEFWKYKDKITKVVFENTINPKNTNLTWDVSVEQNGSVMSYLVPNAGEEELYTLYIQSEESVKANPDSSYLFYRFTKLTAIDGLEYFDVSDVINTSSMFYDCMKLTNLDLSNSNTGNVTNMSSMFYGCSSLTSLNLSNFNTKNVTNMSSMFCGCSSLTSLDLSHFDTSKVTNMSSMFSRLGLINLDLSHLNTSNVTDMSDMFSGCELTNLDLSRFNTSNVTDMSYMFASCTDLTTLNLSNFNTAKVTDMYSMFNKCWSLTTLDLRSFNTSNVENMTGMFDNCSSLTSLNLTSFDISNVKYMQTMFSRCSKSLVIKVKNATMQNWVLTANNGHSILWSTSNVIISF